jgi:WD40 repeat protein
VVAIWDTASGERLHPQGNRGPVRSIAFTADNDLIAIAAGDAIGIHHAANGEDVTSIRIPAAVPRDPLGRQDLYWIGFTDDGRTLITAARFRPEAWAFDARSGSKRWTYQAAEGTGIAAVGLSPDHRLLALALWQGAIHVIDTVSGHVVRVLQLGVQPIAVQIENDGRLWARGADADRPAITRAWTSAGEADQAEPPVTWAEAACRIGGSIDLSRGHISSGPTGLPAAKLGSSYSAIAYSRDGKLVAAAENPNDCLVPTLTEQPQNIRVWEVATGYLRAEFHGHRGDVATLAFSPDGRLLASGGNDTTVLAWSIPH